MSVLPKLPLIGKFAEKLMEKISPDKAASREAQSSLNRAELEGAPASRLRLWRSFLGWALSLCFVWEAVFRPVVCTYWPGALLPPSVLDTVQTLLLGMLGLGF